MEYYAMPQVDKSASTYSPPVQYVPGISAPSPGLVRPDINKFGVSNDILTSCDWSAVIHRPAEESEPEDLPSTVDIDAIKEPATPLPPLTPCHQSLHDKSGTEDDESSDSESEDGASSSDSDSHSQDEEGSGSCRSSSYSDSDSSVSSDKPKDSSSSSSEAREPIPSFSIRETNLEQGGLKLKFSATKPPSNPSQSSSSSDSSSSSSESEEEPKKKPEEEKKSPDLPQHRKSVRSSAVTLRQANLKNARNVEPSPVTVPSDPPRLRQVSSTLRRSTAPRIPPPKVVSPAKKNQTKSSKKGTRPVRKSPRVKPRGVSGQGAESSSQLSSDEDDEDDDDEKEGRESRDEITNLLVAEGPDLSISEHLQEINQEDLAAILPDVGGGSFDGFEEENNGEPSSSGCPSSSQPQASSPAPSHITSSSSSDSDTEQIVSDVISRMQDDSESQQTKPNRLSVPVTRSTNDQSDCTEVGYSSNLLADFVEKTELLSRGTTNASGSGSRSNESSSNVQNTLESSSKRKRGRPPKATKGIATSCRSQNQTNGMPELEAYMRLDCPQSNVSPDSGIQSVAGSPAGHHSLPGSPRSPPTVQTNGPPLLTKAHSPDHLQHGVPSPNEKLTKLISPSKELKLENGGKRGPGRPKSHAFILNTFGRKKRGKRLKRPEILKKPIVLPPSAAELKVPPFIAGAKEGKSNLPSLPLHMSSKRRGRPKKSPPVLEPILPLEHRSRDASDSSRKCSLERSAQGDQSKRKERDIKSPLLISSVSKTKEHKHKKRKRQLLDFRRLDPAFLRELTILSEAFEKCCFISYAKTKSDVTNRRVSKISRKQRRRREKMARKLPENGSAKAHSPAKPQTPHHSAKSPGLKEASNKKSELHNSIENVSKKEKSAGARSEKPVVLEKKKGSTDVVSNGKKGSEKVEKAPKAVEPCLGAEKEHVDQKETSHSKVVKHDVSPKSKKEVPVHAKSISSDAKEVDTKSKISSRESRNLQGLRDKTKKHSSLKERASSAPISEQPLVKENSCAVTEELPIASDKNKPSPIPVSPSKGPHIKLGSSHKDKTTVSPKDKEKAAIIVVKDKSPKALPKETPGAASSSKEKPPLVEEKQLTPPQTSKEKPADAPKDKPVVPPSKEKAPAPQNNKENSDEEAATKEKPVTEQISKEKPTVIQMTKEKTSVATKEKIAPTLAAAKEKAGSSPSQRDKQHVGPKDKPQTVTVNKEKKETVQSPAQKERPTLTSASLIASPQTSAKRRIKKTVVEPPKSKDKLDQTNSNEQRLPLKKRHYHMSSNLSLSDIADKSDESSDSSREVAEPQEELPAHSKLALETPTSNGDISEVPNDQKAPESVIVTPKKRPCPEVEKKPVGFPVKSKDKEVAGKEASMSKRSVSKSVVATPASASAQAKRVSSRQAALKQTEPLETIRTPSSPAPAVKRSQRIKLKHDEEKQHKEEHKSKDVKLKEELKPVKDEKKIRDEPENALNDDVSLSKQEVKTIKEDPKHLKDDLILKAKNTTKPCKVEIKPCVIPCANVPTDLLLSKVKDSDEKKEIPKRTTRSMDEVAEQKINEIMKSDKLKQNPPDKIGSLRHLSPISTRSSSKATLESIAANLVDSALTRSARSKPDRSKSLVGVFEPSSAKAAEILKMPDPHCDVLSKIKTKLLLPDQDIDVEEELKNIKRPVDIAVSTVSSIDRAKRRKVICNVRVHVTKLDPDDIFLKGGKLGNSSDKSATFNASPVVADKKTTNTTEAPEGPKADLVSVEVNKKKPNEASRLSADSPESVKPSVVSTDKSKTSNAVSPSTPAILSSDKPRLEAEKELDGINIQSLQSGIQNKLKVKRKKINRTGFPVKKKKKKRMDLPEPDTVVSTLSTNDFLTSPAIDVTMGNDELAIIDSSQKHISTPVEAPPPSMTPPATPTPSVSTDDVSKGPSEVNMDPTLEKPVQLPAEKTELRPASKRIMELKARSEASERRKRKTSTPESSTSQELQESGPKESSGTSDGLMDLKSLVGKRPRKTKEELDDSDADSVKIRKKQPRWRKKYLPAGLFSDYFKDDEPRKSTGNEKVKSTLYSKLDHEHGLLPTPAYCAKWVRQRRIPFQLPHDIWWLHVHNQLPGREEVPSWNYKKIRTNVYFDVKPSFSYEAQACNCKPMVEIGCGEECINRMVLAECSPQLCPCKEKCSNQKIQRHEWAPGLLRFMTKDKGWGVKTKHKIRKDTFILEYVGEVVSDREFKGRMASRYLNDTHHYCLNLDSGLLIDGHRMGGDGRFVNHSCEPNCEMQKWCVNGLFRMALFALRDIDPNEELTYDYNFSLFNPSEGQQCKCGSSKCRGVIGGKSQRVSIPALQNSAEEKEPKPPGQVGRPRKSLGNVASIGNRRKTNSVDRRTSKSGKDQKPSAKDILNASALATVAARLSHMTALRPLTLEQKEFIILNRIFLTRNLQKVKRRVEKLREAVKKGGLLLPEVAIPPVLTPSATPAAASVMNAVSSSGAGGNPQTNVKKEKEGEREVFMTQLNALNCPRSMRTRRLALAEDNPEMTKTAHLACLFKDLYSEVTTAKDESGDLLSSHFTTLPSKRKFPLYYQRVQKPIDFSTIEQNIVTGVYKTVETFNDDMNALFKNNIRWYGRTSDLGIAATRLRKIYNLGKLNILAKLEEVLGEPPPSSFIPAQDDPSGEEEDVIHCICGIFRDEGMMIQCERCLVWQHCYCVGANSNVENYLCERCSPREVDYEIPSQEEAPAPNQTNYITLLRGDMQLKQGDTVYVLRDIVNEESTEEPKAKHTYKTIKNWKYSDCDIFKIERLWKDEKGSRFAFGHHYLRPHETFHEPTRKFFPNELMRVPLYEVVPIELVMGQCYVLDLNTFCKGRPIGCQPDHLYVCEYRVDKCARMFAKIPKPKHSNICTKSYAFETFDVRLKPQRTYAPHGTPKEDKAPESGNNGGTAKQNVSRGRGGRTAQHHSEDTSANQTPLSSSTSKPTKPKPKPVLKREDRKERLNKLMLKLLSKLPSKQTPLDLSYLLEPGRRQRKKPPLLAS